MCQCWPYCNFEKSAPFKSEILKSEVLFSLILPFWKEELGGDEFISLIIAFWWWAILKSEPFHPIFFLLASYIIARRNDFCWQTFMGGVRCRIKKRLTEHGGHCKPLIFPRQWDCLRFQREKKSVHGFHHEIHSTMQILRCASFDVILKKIDIRTWKSITCLIMWRILEPDKRLLF